MKPLILILVFILTLVLLGIAFGAPQSEMTIQGGRLTIQAGYIDFGKREQEIVTISTTTGQCIGILCGVTHAN